MRSASVCLLVVCLMVGVAGLTWAEGDNCPVELQTDEGKPDAVLMERTLDAGEHTYAATLSDREALTSMLAPNPLTKVVANVFIREHAPTDWDWSLASATLMAGVMAAWEETREQRYFDYVKHWADYHLERGLKLDSIAACVPGGLLLALYEQTQDLEYLEGANQACAAAVALSTEGAEPPANSGPEAFCYGTYRDLVVAEFCIAPFLARMGQLNHDRKCFDLAAEKSVRYMDYLRFYRRDTGPLKERVLREELCTHMLKEEGNRLFPNLDKRGDGWLYLSMGETFGFLPENHPLRGRLITFLENQGFRSLDFSPMVLGAAAGSLKIQYTRSLYVYGAAELLAVRPVEKAVSGKEGS